MPKTFLNYKGTTLATVYETNEVVANPTLEGSEETLEGLEIGKTKYKVGGGSGGTSNVITDIDLQSLVGKHLSVDKLIAFLKSKNIVRGSNFYILGGFCAQDYNGIGYGIEFNSGSDTTFRILEENVIDISYDTDYETTFLNAKTDIENIIIKHIEYPTIYSNCVRGNYDEATGVYETQTITLQEFLDLFEE